MLIPMIVADSASVQVGIQLNARGPNVGIASACSTSLDAVGLALETIRRGDAEVMIAGGTQPTGIDAVEWAKKVEQLGAGAILPTSMDADGTLAGYDIPMTRAIADAVSLPVIASGGAGTLEHLAEAIVEGHADAVLVASIAHFGTFTIAQMKQFLADNGIPVRM